jgi:hypothetical protein
MAPGVTERYPRGQSDVRASSRNATVEEREGKHMAKHGAKVSKLGVAVVTALSMVTVGACTTGPSDPDAGPPPFELVMDTLTDEQGWTVGIPTFEVPRGTEVQDCYFVTVPDFGVDQIWVDKVELGMNPGSHHFNVYRVTKETELKPENGVDVTLDNGVPAKLIKSGACFDSSNFNEFPLVVNNQHATVEEPVFTWSLPDGVAFPLARGELLMFQPHYVNASDQVTPYMGRGQVNFHRTFEENPMELGTLFATQQSIRVCQSDADPFYVGTCSFPQEGGVRIAAVNGHFHLRGEEFTIKTWDGVSVTEPPDENEFYQSYAWQEPIMMTGLDLEVPEGGGIWWTCDYEWKAPGHGTCDDVNAVDPDQADDCCYTFGPHVETQEHCNVFLYYWPKTANTDVFCN